MLFSKYKKNRVHSQLQFDPDQASGSIQCLNSAKDKNLQKRIQPKQEQRQQSVKSSVSSLKISIELKNTIMKDKQRKYQTEVQYNPRQNQENQENDYQQRKIAERNELKKLGFTGQIKNSLVFKKKQSKTEATFLCSICEQNCLQSAKASIDNCHYFCLSCLHHYAIYKISVMEDVSCPDSECDKILKKNDKFLKTLPAEVQKRYKRHLLFKQTSKNPDLKLCPSEQCQQGVINVKAVQLKCDKCNIQFCKKCELKKHQGPCSGEIVSFFQNNLRYRQCNKCKNVIQKIQGCDHMKCKCGNRFCYQCGTSMSANHECRNGVAIPPQPSCYQRYLGQCPLVLKVVLKPFIFLLLIIPTIAILGYLILMMFFLVFILFFQGIFNQPCKLCDQQNSCLIRILMVVFFPITIIVGIGVQFYIQFCTAADQLVFLTFDSIKELYLDAWKF